MATILKSRLETYHSAIPVINASLNELMLIFFLIGIMIFNNGGLTTGKAWNSQANYDNFSS